MILAGDVGGTNVRLALIEVEGGKLARKDEKTFLSRDVPGLEQPVALVNDLFANALGLGEFGPADFAVVNAGVEDPAGNAALIAAGTGLGEVYLVMVSGRFVPQASEGGHASFAPKILPKLLDGTFFGAFCDKGASPRSLREFRSRWS